MPKHATLARHPPRRRRRRRAAQARAGRAARAHRDVVVLVLLALGAGRTIVEPHGERASARGERRRERARSTCKTTHVRAPAAPARRSRCPARCRASCRRRSRRAPSGYLRALDQGHRQPRRARASCSPRSSRPRSTSSCRRRCAARQQTAASLDARQEHGRALGERCARRTSSRSRSSTSAAAADAQARANLAAADANVERLRQLEGFKRVVAPFAGVITRAQRRRRRPDRRGSGAGRRCSC